MRRRQTGRVGSGCRRSQRRGPTRDLQVGSRFNPPLDDTRLSAPPSNSYAATKGRLGIARRRHDGQEVIDLLLQRHRVDQQEDKPEEYHSQIHPQAAASIVSALRYPGGGAKTR